MKQSNKADEAKDKLKELQDRSKRENLRFDGIAEYENESWTETEDVVKDTSNETSDIRSIQIERPEACNFIEKDSDTGVFPVNFANFLRTPFLQNTSGRLLPVIVFHAK